MYISEHMSSSSRQNEVKKQAKTRDKHLEISKIGEIVDKNLYS